jgi:PAS domain-containing protein
MPSEVAEVMSEEQFASSSPIGNGGKRGQLSPITRLYQTAFRWFQANTFAPKFLASPWSHPAFGYLVAVLGQVLAVTAITLIDHGLPSFRFAGVIVLLTVLLVAFGWGAGPGLVATLVGAVLLEFLIVPPIFSFAVAQVVDLFGVILYLVVGFTLSIFASQAQQARSRLKILSTRLETIIEAIPDSLFILDAQGAPPRVNVAARTLLGLADAHAI